MTKALALVAIGLGRATWLVDAIQRREDLVSEIRSRRGPDAWGYEFDVQTRWGFYPAHSPNAIVTAFAIEAVAESLDVNEQRTVINWLTGPMWAERFFRYVPGNDTLVHNASLLCARALYRLAPGHPHVDAALRTCVARMPASGLWPYGEAPGLEWVDNFHTAYVLDALLDLEPSFPWIRPSVEAAVSRYVVQCFSDLGTPHYYAGGGGPLDLHNVATAVSLTHRLAQTGQAESELARSCLAFALNFQRRDGAFVARPHAIPFVRWNQAHMHRALSEVAV